MLEKILQVRLKRAHVSPSIEMADMRGPAIGDDVITGSYNLFFGYNTRDVSGGEP
jgi:hypothetical protein